MIDKNTLILIILGAVAFLSLITFILYAVDKSRARQNQWRIPEKVLLLFGFLGGALGGILGMKTFHHKTKHWYFWVINVLGLLIHVGAVLYVKFFLNI